MHNTAYEFAGSMSALFLIGVGKQRCVADTNGARYSLFKE